VFWILEWVFITFSFGKPWLRLNPKKPAFKEETYITGALVMPNLNREEQTHI